MNTQLPLLAPSEPPTDDPLTHDELVALSRIGWEVLRTYEKGGVPYVLMRYFDRDAPEQMARTPGGWRIMIQ